MSGHYRPISPRGAGDRPVVRRSASWISKCERNRHGGAPGWARRACVVSWREVTIADINDDRAKDIVDELGDPPSSCTPT
jgi:hypothetical protein